MTEVEEGEGGGVRWNKREREGGNDGWMEGGELERWA